MVRFGDTYSPQFPATYLSEYPARLEVATIGIVDSLMPKEAATEGSAELATARERCGKYEPAVGDPLECVNQEVSKCTRACWSRQMAPN